MNVCNQYIVGILVCLRLIALPAYAIYTSEDSSTGAQLYSEISMELVKQTCGWETGYQSDVIFGNVSPKEIQKGSNKKEFFFKVLCRFDNGYFNVKVVPQNGVMGSEEDGFIATNRKDVAILLTWRSTNFDSQIQADSPVKLNTVYHFDKANNAFNEVRLRAQLVSWPLNTLIPLVDPITNNRNIANTSIKIEVSYM